MKLLIPSLIAAISFGQSLVPTVNQPSVLPGSAFTISLGYVDIAPSSLTAGIQWDAPVVPGITFAAPIAGAATTAAGKSVGGVLHFLAAPLTPPFTSTAFSSGVIATIVGTVSATATPGMTTITIPNVFASTATGSKVTLAVPSVTILVGSVAPVCGKFDLSCNGAVGNEDVVLALQQAEGMLPCTNGDVNGDGKCTIADVYAVINAIPGLQNPTPVVPAAPAVIPPVVRQ